MTVMNSLDAHRIVSEISYKPGWVFTYAEPDTFPVVYATYTTACSRRLGDLITLHLSIRFEQGDLVCWSEDTFVKRLWMWLRDIEIHESLEWFKVRGERIVDPHAPVLLPESLGTSRELTPSSRDDSIRTT